MWERALGCLVLNCPGHGLPCSASKVLRGPQSWLKRGQDLLPLSLTLSSASPCWLCRQAEEKGVKSHEFYQDFKEVPDGCQDQSPAGSPGRVMPGTER